MERRVLVLGSVVAVCVGIALATALPAAAATVPTGRLIPTSNSERLPLHGGVVTSLNWSGYAVTPASSNITAVDSTFTVPSAGLTPPGFAATWTGIGGYSTSDLIQAGVAEDSAPTNPLLGDQYYAWYELLPNDETQLTDCVGDSSCAVTPGDQITVDISNVSGDTWDISLTDGGKWSWSDDVSYVSSESSAEWILEAPTLAAAQTPLADVGTVGFGPTSSYTAGGTTYTIAAGDPTTIDLSPLPTGGILDEATPSALAADGQSFNDCSYAQTCATP
jgi:hypothetical protein